MKKLSYARLFIFSSFIIIILDDLCSLYTPHTHFNLCKWYPTNKYKGVMLIEVPFRVLYINNSVSCEECGN